MPSPRKYKIVVADVHVKKKKNYLSPPTNFTAVQPDEKKFKANEWFKFSQKSEYYPIAIVDVNKPGEYITGGRKVQLTVSCSNTGGKDPETYKVTASPMGNVFWFSAIRKLFVTGKFVISFSCLDDKKIEDLSFEMDVKTKGQKGHVGPEPSPLVAPTTGPTRSHKKKQDHRPSSQKSTRYASHGASGKEEVAPRVNSSTDVLALTGPGTPTIAREDDHKSCRSADVVGSSGSSSSSSGSSNNSRSSSSRSSSGGSSSVSSSSGKRNAEKTQTVGVLGGLMMYDDDGDGDGGRDGKKDEIKDDRKGDSKDDNKDDKKDDKIDEQEKMPVETAGDRAAVPVVSSSSRPSMDRAERVDKSPKRAAPITRRELVQQEKALLHWHEMAWAGILEFPKIINTDARTRIEQPVYPAVDKGSAEDEKGDENGDDHSKDGGGDGGNDDNNHGEGVANKKRRTTKDKKIAEVPGIGVQTMLVRGAVLEVNLPASLSRALLDDREASFQLCEYARLHKQHAPKDKDKDFISEALRHLSHPTVSDLLQILKQKGASYIKQVDSVVDQMRTLFELCFEEHLLYPHEREALRPKINTIRSSRKCFADEFGVYYYLRLLIFIVKATQYPTLNPNHTDSPTPIDAQSSTPLENTRQTATHRHVRTSFGKLQEVVVLAVKTLDDHAHLLFY